MKHFITIAECTREQLRRLLDVARQLKHQYRTVGRNEPILEGKTLAMVFEKPSLRTRVSFTVAMNHLGGDAMMLRQEEVGLDTREPAKDIARVLSSMSDGIMARTFRHAPVVEMARYSTVPVINGLTDMGHPCQAMTDVMTVEEHFGSLAGRTIAFVGDGNNVARSLAVACGKFAMRFILASPKAYRIPDEEIDRLMTQVPEMDFVTMDDPREAVHTADVIYTDTWVSMGQESEKLQRLKDFADYQVNRKLLDTAPSHAVVLHCLPAYRGCEITDEIMEHERCLAFPQAENRLHFQKGLLAVLLGGA